MNETSGNVRDRSGAAVRPPIVWALTAIAGLALDWLVLAAVHACCCGGRLARRHNVPRRPGPADLGGIDLPAGRDANPDHSANDDDRRRGALPLHPQPDLCRHLPGLAGLGVGFDSLRLLILLVPFYLVIRYGVVAREEAYLQHKFGDVYRAYKARVRRWL